MKKNLCLVQKMRVAGMAGLVLLSLAVGGTHAQAKPQLFNHLFVFGDSLSDTGNYYRLSGGSPPPPYVGGRFCNGPVWVEYLSASLGMDYEPADNFAVGGATTGTFNSNNGFAGREYPGLLDQVASFTANSTTVKHPERALCVVGAGANDFFIALSTGASPADVIANGVNNTISAVQQLRAVGARFILVMNVPDLGVTPMALNMGLSEQLAQLTAAYNDTLSHALDQLAQAGIPTIRLDSYAVLDDMAKHPAQYGFAIVTVPFLFAPAGSNPDEFLFWDPVHPTTGAHEVLAEEALDQIVEAVSFCPGLGKDNEVFMHGWGMGNVHRH